MLAERVDDPSPICFNDLYLTDFLYHNKYTGCHFDTDGFLRLASERAAQSLNRASDFALRLERKPLEIG